MQTVGIHYNQTRNLRDRIKKYTVLMENTSKSIAEDLKDYFKNYDYSKPNSDIQIIKVETENDLKKIYYGTGFYIILTNKIFEKNPCQFDYQNLKAIYRGHSYFTKKRILSHLSNEYYNSTRKSNEPNYKVCLKIEDKINGININQEPYKDWKWTVIVHKMKNSSKLIREQMEIAFDNVFQKPCKSIK
tara:strand:- start:1332 stop:1895 length:564 start_codon:yes stop_codon:yes gene_type:complete